MFITNAQTLPDIGNAVDAIVKLHGKYFVQQLKWGATFENDVREYLDELLQNYQPNIDGLWVAKNENNFIGSIAIDGRQYDQKCARLRVFIVDPYYHHQGIGKSLLSQAVTFCKSSGYQRIELWTFDDLFKAKKLYLSYGFSVIQERSVVSWGCQLREQLFCLELQQASS
jgi:GNAT superfamily N-acetyltransferase